MSIERSENIRDLEPSATLAVGIRAKELRAQGRDVIDLSSGEPDLPTPAFIAEAGIDAIRRGFTRYTAVPGIPELRDAIAAALSRRNGARADPAGVVVSNGAKQALFNVCFALFGPGDRVLVPAPYWTSYPPILQLARAEPVLVDGDESNGFKVDPDRLEEARDARVRGVILNSPGNPTGAVYSRAELEAVVGWAAERGIWILADEIYGRLCFTADRAPSVLDLEPRLLDRVVLIDGASKVFAMTGWRVGFSYCDPALARLVSALQSQTTSNASTPAQYAALAAYLAEPPQDEPIRELGRIFHRRRDLVRQLFADHLPELPFVRPDGTFFLFFRADAAFGDGVADSIAFCQRILDTAGVALVPGAAFGDDRYVRLSFAASEESLEQGIRRLAGALRPQLTAST